MTRRAVHADIVADIVGNGDNVLHRCPYGGAGDRLWVREAFRAPVEYDDMPPRDIPEGTRIDYCADGGTLFGRYRPPMFMPRWMSRGLDEITAVRIERLQDISAKDILAEGAVDRPHVDQFGKNPVSSFDGMVYLDLKSLWAAGWEKINGKGSFALNPWVWVVEFKVIK